MFIGPEKEISLSVRFNFHFPGEVEFFPSVLQHCWMGDRKGIRPVKSWALVCWWWWFDWSFSRLIASIVTTTFIILSSSKIQNGVILLPAYLDRCENWPLNECSVIVPGWLILDYYILYSELLKLWRCRLQIPLPTCLSRNLQMVRRWWFKLLQHLVNMHPPLIGGGIKRCFCLTSVCHVHRA